MNRRGFAFKGIVASGVSVMGSSVITEPVKGQFFAISYSFFTLFFWVKYRNFDTIIFSSVIVTNGFNSCISAYHVLT